MYAGIGVHMLCISLSTNSHNATKMRKYTSCGKEWRLYIQTLWIHNFYQLFGRFVKMVGKWLRLYMINQNASTCQTLWRLLRRERIFNRQNVDKKWTHFVWSHTNLKNKRYIYRSKPIEIVNVENVKNLFQICEDRLLAIWRYILES